MKTRLSTATFPSTLTLRNIPTAKEPDNQNTPQRKQGKSKLRYNILVSRPETLVSDIITDIIDILQPFTELYAGRRQWSHLPAQTTLLRHKEKATQWYSEIHCCIWHRTINYTNL